MSIRLPDSPIRKLHRCPDCNNFSVKFWNSNFDRTYTHQEWLTICEEGKEVLRKILQPIREDPKFFLD